MVSQDLQAARKIALRMSFGKRLREAREEAGLSQEEIGRLFDPPVTRNTVSNWERDENMPESDKLSKIARKVHRTTDFLLSGYAIEQQESHYNVRAGPEIRAKVPLISWVRAGEFEEAADHYHVGDAEDWLPSPKKAGSNTYALRVEGDSMTAPHGKSYPAGSIIFVDPDQRSPTNGQRIIAKLEGSSEVTFKVFVAETGQAPFLKPLNSQHPRIDRPFRVIGTVVGKWEDE